MSLLRNILFPVQKSFPTLINSILDTIAVQDQKSIYQLQADNEFYEKVTAG